MSSELPTSPGAPRRPTNRFTWCGGWTSGDDRLLDLGQRAVRRESRRELETKREKPPRGLPRAAFCNGSVCPAISWLGLKDRYEGPLGAALLLARAPPAIEGRCIVDRDCGHAATRLVRLAAKVVRVRAVQLPEA